MKEQAKRAAPARVSPLIAGNIRYEGEETREFFDNEIINMGTTHVRAYNNTSNQLLWDSEIYEKTTYDPHEETDVQWSFITEISLDQEGKLLVTNEDQETYLVDQKTGEVLGRK